jgi:hypothetical protein
MSRPDFPEPVFRSFPLSAPPPPPTGSAFTGIASIVVHVLALGALLVLPLLGEDRMPDHTGQVSAFFAAPLELAPPPPPPPPVAPLDVKVLRGVPLLDEAAVEAVRQWVYTPTLVNGVPTPVMMTVTVHFRLYERP